MSSLTVTTPPGQDVGPDRLVLALGALPALVAALALAGGWAGAGLLTTWVPGLPALDRRSAAGLLLLGAAVALAERSRRGEAGRRAAGVAARLAAALALACGAASPSLPSALGLACVALALLVVLARPPHPRLAQLLAAVAAALCLVAVAGHIHGAVVVLGQTRLVGLSLPAAIGLLSGAAAAVVLERDAGLRVLLVHPGLTGRHLRQLALAAVLVPLGTALLLRGGELLGWYDEHFRSGAYLALVTLLLCAGAWLAGRTLLRAEAQRRRVEEERSARAVAEALAADLETQVEERQRLFAEVREALRVRDRFMSLAAHELRSPLTALQLQAHLLVRTCAAGAEGASRAAGLAGRLSRQVDRLEQVIANLLDAARVNEGGLRVAPRELELGALVESVADGFTERFRAAGSALQLEVTRVSGRWDPEAVGRVVSNLLDNAAKYGGGQPVTLRVEAVEGGARLSVRDRGAGIAEVEQALVFDRFRRASGAVGQGGLGLGLWIVRQLVEAMGGQVSLSSALGEGSTFVVTLPREPPAAPVARGAPGAEAAGPVPPELLTGHAEIDAQHAAILEELERLHSAPTRSIFAALDFLAGHVATHFRFEEALMLEVGYPGRTAHAQAHARFAKELDERTVALERSGAGPEDVGALVRLVETWVADHVRGEDLALAAFTRATEQRAG